MLPFMSPCPPLSILSPVRSSILYTYPLVLLSVALEPFEMTNGIRE